MKKNSFKDFLSQQLDGLNLIKYTRFIFPVLLIVMI